MPAGTTEAAKGREPASYRMPLLSLTIWTTHPGPCAAQPCRGEGLSPQRTAVEVSNSLALQLVQGEEFLWKYLLQTANISEAAILWPTKQKEDRAQFHVGPQEHMSSSKF